MTMSEITQPYYTGRFIVQMHLQYIFNSAKKLTQ